MNTIEDMTKIYVYIMLAFLHQFKAMFYIWSIHSSRVNLKALW